MLITIRCAPFAWRTTDASKCLLIKQVQKKGGCTSLMFGAEKSVGHTELGTS